jgi:hypothetical protein
VALQVDPERAEARTEALEFVEMQRAQLPKSTRTERGQPQPHDTLIKVVDVTRDEPRLLGAIDETDRAVMTQQQRFRDVTDSGTTRVVVTAYRQEQLVLRGSEPGGLRLLLAPVEEPAEAGAERQQPHVLRIAEVGHVEYIVLRHGEVS